MTNLRGWAKGQRLVDKICVVMEVRGCFFSARVLPCYLLLDICVRIYLASLLAKQKVVCSSRRY